MSRHRHGSVMVGWDHPMLTFFAQDYTTEDEETGEPGWSTGNKIREHYDLDTFKRDLARHGITLPIELEGQLYMDRDLGR